MNISPDTQRKKNPYRNGFNFKTFFYPLNSPRMNELVGRGGAVGVKGVGRRKQNTINNNHI